MSTQSQDNTYSVTHVSPYQYWACVDRIVDGDTVDLTVSLGFDIEVKQRFRLLGIDTPEIFSVRRDSEEWVAGMAAKAFLESFIPVGSWVEIIVSMSNNREKYGRWLGELLVDGTSLNQRMIDEGHAVALG